MQRKQVRRASGNAPGNASDDVVALLTDRQYLRPHQPVREALRATMDELGCCPEAVRRAIEWLQVDTDQAIGRLRRGELIQLGKSISRFWRAASRESDAATNRSPH